MNGSASPGAPPVDTPRLREAVASVAFLHVYGSFPANLMIRERPAPPVKNAERCTTLSRRRHTRLRNTRA
ncbi:hypothetical protein PCAR4_570342 [Paraburkholderia caribensis]|nr:hypothetical protein PCAR4_570342 [Paraburkholderia caribensis]